MLSVSRNGEFNPWVQFVAQGVMAQANEAISRIEQLIQIRAPCSRHSTLTTQEGSF